MEPNERSAINLPVNSKSNLELEVHSKSNLDLEVDSPESVYPKYIHAFEVKSFKNFSVESDSPEEMQMKKFPLITIENQTQILNSENRRNSNVNSFKRNKIPALKSEEKAFGCSESEKKKVNSRFFKLLMRFYLVKKFITKLREIANIYDHKSLKAPHYALLQDFTIFPHAKKEKIKDFKMDDVVFSNSRKKKFLQYLFHRLKITFGFVIHPTNNWRLFWDFIQILLDLIFFVLLPLSFGFEEEIFEQFPVIKWLSLVLFAFDLFVNFNTAYYCKGELIVSKANIARSYFHNGFLWDCSSLSFLFLNGLFHMSCNDIFVKVTAFFFILRIRNVSRAISRFEDFIFSDEKVDNIISFVKLTFIILLFSHWSACLWILIGKREGSGSWLDMHDLSPVSQLAQYVNALYYVVVVINTVGFGDIVSHTTLEKTYTIFFIYIASVIFAFTLNGIGMILQNINRSERELKRNLNLINGFMKSKNIEFNLKIKIKNYMEYIWQAEKNQNQKEVDNIVNRLSKSLKEELLLNANGVIIKETPLLNNNFSEQTLRKLVWDMKEVKLTPGDLIYCENDTNDDNLYIIRDGEVELFLNSTNANRKTTLATLKKGQHFGESAFFSGIPRDCSAMSVSFSSLFVIKKEEFIQILKETPQDFEKFCEIKDKLVLSGDISKLFTKCSCCNVPNHPTSKCPYLHLTLSREKVIERFNFCVSQERTAFARKRKLKRFNSFSNYSKIQIQAKKIMDDFTHYDPQESFPNEGGSLDSVNFEKSEKEQPDKELFPQKSPGINIISSIKNEKVEEKNQEDQRIMNCSSISANLRKGKSFEKNEEGKDFLNCKSLSMNSMQFIDNSWKIENLEQMLAMERKNFEMDSMRVYAFYYSEHNIDLIIQKINKSAERKMKKLKSMFNIFNPHTKNNIPSQDSIPGMTQKTLNMKRLGTIGERRKSFFGRIRMNSVKGNVFLGKNSKIKKESFWPAKQINNLRGKQGKLEKMRHFFKNLFKYCFKH